MSQNLSSAAVVIGPLRVNTINKHRSKIVETDFLVVICQCQSKALFLVIFNPRSLIVKSFFDCHLSGVKVFGGKLDIYERCTISL